MKKEEAVAAKTRGFDLGTAIRLDRDHRDRNFMMVSSETAGVCLESGPIKIKKKERKKNMKVRKESPNPLQTPEK